MMQTAAGVGGDKPAGLSESERHEADEGRRGVIVAPFEPTLLESALPVVELSRLAHADRRASDPVYSAHRWWARRPPALMRGLLLAAALPAATTPEEFWRRFASTERPLAGLLVHDPFAGGGSTLVEAARLGAAASGTDVDPLAVEIVSHELAPPVPDELAAAGEALLAHLRATVGHLYPKNGTATPLHYFWLHEVACPHCNERGLLYRDLILARDSEKPGAVVRDHPLTVFCPDDLSVHELDRSDRKQLWCEGHRHMLDTGTFRRYRYHCTTCQGTATHAQLRTGVAVRRLVAVELTGVGDRRRVVAPRRVDHTAGAAAHRYLIDRGHLLNLPGGSLTADRQDPRPLSFGINTPTELFTDRQLVVLGTAMRWLAAADLGPDIQRAMTLALSNSLATNNKLCSYAADYGRLSALFSVRGYSIPALPVELNPLHPDAGRGTIRHCIDRVVRSTQTTVRRYVWSLEKRAPTAIHVELSTAGPTHQVLCASAISEPAGQKLADLCIFDPPYFDYIAYSELSEFYRSWLATPELAGKPLLPEGDNRAERFGLALAECLRGALRRLSPGRPLAFTYHSAAVDAWRAIGVALDDAKLAVTAVWPVRSDGHMGHHSHAGNCEWDVVMVCRRVEETTPSVLGASLKQWARQAKPWPLGEADKGSMALALATAAPRFGTVQAKESGDTK